MDDQTPQLSDDATDGFHIEVTPLSASPATTVSQPTPTRFRTPAWRAAVMGAVIVIALAVIFGGYLPVRTPLTGWAQPQPTATSTPEPTPVLFGKVPTYCPPGNPVETFSPSFGPGVGVYGLHVWFVGFVGPQATAQFTNSAVTPHGWPYKLLLAAAPDVTQPMTLSADVMFTAVGSVSFSMGSLDNVTTSLTLDPHMAAPQADGWRSYVFYIFLPSAGCYYLNIEYGGQSHPGTYFAAGT